MEAIAVTPEQGKQIVQYLDDLGDHLLRHLEDRKLMESEPVGPFKSIRLIIKLIINFISLIISLILPWRSKKFYPQEVHKTFKNPM